MKLRIVPWFTTASVEFMNNIFKWYPHVYEDVITVLEWGGGNSTGYFLGKGCKVMTVEDDQIFIDSLLVLAKQLEKKVKVVTSVSEIRDGFGDFELMIYKADSLDEVGKEIFEIDWSIIVNDGVSRKEVMQSILSKGKKSIVIIDNVEYCANWGRLARSSAKKDTVISFRKFLEDRSWDRYLFEQPEGREGHCVPDSTGWESPNRWITGVFWKDTHVFSRLKVTHIGVPVINIEGIDNKDLSSLEERCPYDFDNNKWVKEEYPAELDLKLKRDFT